MLTFNRSFALHGLLLASLLPLGCSSSKEEVGPSTDQGDVTGNTKHDGGTGKDGGTQAHADASSTKRDAAPQSNDDPDSGACNVVHGEGVAHVSPVDIVWVIDDSGSMLDDTTRIQQNMATFAKSLIDRGLDYRIIMIDEPLLVLAPPWDPKALGLDPMRFFSYPVVAFNDCYTPALASFSSWQANLRPDAALHFIMVTDDNSLMSWTDFKSQMDTNLMGRKYTVHAIVDPPQHCLGSTRPGTAYWEGAAATGGQQRSICESDWSPTFSAIEDSIASSAQIPCNYDIPTPSQGQSYDLTQINVQHVLDGNSTPYKRKDSMDACGSEAGWYYDDPTNPTKVLLCPASCSEVEAQGGSINVDFVCKGLVYL